MRVIIIPSWYPSEQAPLAGIFFAEQAELLARHAPSLDVHVFAVPRRDFEVPFKRPHLAARVLRAWCKSDKYRRRVERQNYVVHTFESLSWSSRVAQGGLGYEATRMLCTARDVQRERGHIDLVHAHACFPGGYVGGELARKLKVPLVVSEHMSPFPFEDLLGSNGRPRPEAVSPIRSADRVTAVSCAHAQSIQRFVNRSIDVVPNFIDSTMFFPKNTAPNCEKAVNFLSVGHLCAQKGFDVLLKALRLALDAGAPLRLSIVGQGVLAETLQRLAFELGVDDAVSWLGAPNRASMPNIYRGADAFVLASRHESFGVVVIEALASGLPVVATRCGGPEEIVTNECGRIVPTEDPAALAAAMAEVARKKYERHEIRLYFERNFSAEAVVPRVLALYNAALTNRREPG